MNRHSWLVLLTVLLSLFIFEFVTNGIRLREWDHMFVSGYVAVVVGVFLSLDARRRMREAVQRLARRGVMSIPEDIEGYDFLERFEARVLSWSHRIALLIGALLLAVFLAAYWEDLPGIRIAETVLGTIAGYCVGRIIGRMIIYGFLGWTIRDEKITLTAFPGHVDGAGGFKPLGDFYFFQAVLLAIPVLFVGIWSLLIPAWDRYSGWQDLFLVLFGVAIVFEVLSFVSPMWSIHEEMRNLKAAFQVEADQLSKLIAWWRKVRG